MTSSWAITPLFLLYLGLPQVSRGEPLYNGLPTELPADVTQDWISFEAPMGGIRVPLGFDFIVNGAPVPTQDRASLERIFSEEHLAWLPASNRIGRDADASGREVWDYPVGTRVAHAVRLKSPDPTIKGPLFELRWVEKQRDGRWSFGLYASRKDSPARLELQTEDAAETLRFRTPQNDDVSMRRIKIQSCRACHFMNSASAYQYETQEQAGPCGFVPSNHANVRSWAERMRQGQGFQPFQPEL